MPFVDRDLGNWQPASRGRLVNLIAQTYRNTDASTIPDATNGAATLLTEISDPNWASGILPCSEAWYDAGESAGIGSIFYDWERPADTSSAAAWYWDVAATTADDGSVAVTTTGNLKAATSTPAYFDAGGQRFGRLFFGHTTSPNTGSDGKKFGLYWKRLAVIGNHGLPLIGDTDPKGVAASDVIRYLIATYCPKLNTAGVQNTTYPIGHLSFRERTKVYDALLKVNSYHLWQIAVWEEGTVHFGPVDLTDWDWEVRHDVRGTSVGLQGDSVEQLRNGIIVTFTNVATGAVQELHPDDYSELRDDSIDNPWNQHGDTAYGEPFTIPFPCTQRDALELGRLQMLEDNQVKAPGAFMVEHYIYDRAGVPQPVWKVRAGDRVRLTSTANLSDRPRLVQEVSYAHDSKTATIAVDSTLRLLEGFIDRMSTALQAAGLA
jgi:hypothetical protein